MIVTDEQKSNVFRFADLYGPYAFGVVSLLLIWYAIVKPELDHRAIDFAQQTKIVQSMNDRDRVQDSIARSLASTAESLSATATILERATERFEDRK